MTAPPIAGSNRYIPEGVTKFSWVPTLANYHSPTRTELNSGTDLSPEIAASGDWSVDGNPIATPDLVSTFTGQIAGLTTAGTTTLNMYADPAGTDARTLMPRLATGYIIKFDGGDVAGRLMDVYPVQVISNPRPVTLGGTPTTINFTYSVTHQPAEGVTIPA